MTTFLILVPLAIAWIAVMGWILVQMQEHPGTHCAPRPVNGRNLGTMPRLTTPDRPPWHTMPHPVLLLEPLPDSGHYPAEEFTDLPVVPGFMRPEYGQACVLRVDEAQRLAGVMLP